MDTINIKDYNLTELRALCYDIIVQMNLNKENLFKLETEIDRRKLIESSQKDIQVPRKASN